MGAKVAQHEKPISYTLIKKMVVRVFHKSFDFADAERWDIEQHVRMSPKERQKAARELKRRVFGKFPLDVRDAHKAR
jgi:hypothetical protein